MKNSFYTISALIIVSLLGISFYFTLFNLFVVSPLLGVAIVAALGTICFVMVNDEDFIGDLEESSKTA